MFHKLLLLVCVRVCVQPLVLSLIPSNLPNISVYFLLLFFFFVVLDIMQLYSLQSALNFFINFMRAVNFASVILY